MRYKREEPLRYQFAKPIPLTFSITKVEGIEKDSSNGEGKILDLSPGGLKFESILELPIRDDVEFTFTFQMGEESFEEKGVVKWKKDFRDQLYQYGAEFLTEDSEARIIEAIKGIANSERS
ncbi:PilZ domain-containing protein [Bacillus shivajii]|uniref:PilZ domain-containing protein n=1 Tax=Bacillus shivajii TaxID=1983719 RepID=UPI001CFC0252|nr:PilZ domain-containing protein [Bacillus shivajii]UCZ53121.1 PilZ domain-containing protein [Bacillus shivajii]